MGRLPRIRLALAGFGVVLVVGTLGYLALGFGLLDAIYQTVTTVTTVGFREVEPLSPAGQVFTIVLILVGVGQRSTPWAPCSKDSLKATSARTWKGDEWTARSAG